MHRPRRSLELMRWGLVPHWAKDTKFTASRINARTEMLSEKPSFRPLLEHNRCIIMVSGFYEGQRDGQEKMPYKVEREDLQPMLLAGLSARNDRLDIESYVMITAAAPSAFTAITTGPLPFWSNRILKPGWTATGRRPAISQKPVAAPCQPCPFRAWSTATATMARNCSNRSAARCHQRA